MRLIDLTGKRFGRLAVVGRNEIGIGRVKWLCVCECGNKITASAKDLRSGNTKSCGCLIRDLLTARNKKALLTGRRWVFRGEEERKVAPDQVPSYLMNGYSLGRPPDLNARPAKERAAEFRAKRAAAGLCIRCLTPSMLGKQVCESHFLYFQKKEKENIRRLKKLVIEGYGGKCQCTGCNEYRFEFMTVDHVNNDGAEHRRHKQVSGESWYSWLIANKFPKEYQLLCWNCNCSKGFYGECPHVRENAVAQSASAGRA